VRARGRWTWPSAISSSTRSFTDGVADRHVTNGETPSSRGRKDAAGGHCMCKWRSAACLLFVLTASGTASAQDHGPVGVTMAFPAAIGVIFHATDKVAVRPEFTFNHNSTELTTLDATSWSVGTGVSALFYLRTQDRVQTYISPRFSYTHAESNAVGTTAV